MSYPVSTNISDTDGSKWKAFCGSNKKTSYQLLREIIEYVIGSRSSLDLVPLEVIGSTGSNPVERVVDPPVITHAQVDPIQVDPTETILERNVKARRQQHDTEEEEFIRRKEEQLMSEIAD
jgi:hypothetical protein